jgi:hypothetical protein
MTLGNSFLKANAGTNTRFEHDFRAEAADTLCPVSGAAAHESIIK